VGLPRAVEYDGDMNTIQKYRVAVFSAFAAAFSVWAAVLFEHGEVVRPTVFTITAVLNAAIAFHSYIRRWPTDDGSLTHRQNNS
jgi:hypothetical protein